MDGGTFMDETERPHIDSVEIARKAIVEQLRREWPYAASLTPHTIAGRVADAVFVEAAAGLMEEGLIMYEALLVGAGPSPRLVDAVLTRRGQLWESGA